MTENEFLDIRKSVFLDISNSNHKKEELEKQIKILKQQQTKKVADCDKMQQVKDIDAKRSLILEEYKLSIMAKEALVQKEEATIERAQVYFKYVVALHADNKTDIKNYKEQLLEVLQKQAIDECNTPISIIQQKRIAANALKQYLELNPNANKDDSVTISNEELDEDRMKEFDIKGNKALLEQAFKKEKPQLNDSLMKSKATYTMSPSTTIKNIYPNYKDQMLAREQNKGKVA